jgi:hypothetical protein
MTDRQLRRASRADLLKLLLEQRKESEALRQQISQMEEQLQRRQIAIDQSGTLAEAALKLSGIFGAAETACQYYTENIRALSGRQEEICCAMEQETREKCDRMIEQAKHMAKVYWDEYTEKCNRYMKTMENARRTAEPNESEQMEML